MINKFDNSFKLNEDQLTAFKQIIPEAFKDGMVDIGALSDALSDYTGKDTLDIDDNLFGLYWPGKKAAKRAATIPPVGTLVPVPGDGVDEETTRNIYIEGDNLEVLKIIRKAYKGQVKMIYIDPPYNTGNDFIYDDDFTEADESYLQRTGQIDENKNKLVANPRSDGRFHSKWLTMMYPRLRLAKDLLTDDGVIFISIDDNEVTHLRKICDEIFGEENNLGIFIINSTPNARDYGHIGKMHEFTIFFAKDNFSTTTNLLPEIDKSFRYADEKGGYNIHPLYNSNEAFTNENRPNLYYPFYIYQNEKISDDFYKIGLDNKDGSIEIYPPKSLKNAVQFVWRWGKEKAMQNLNIEIIGYKTSDGEYRIVQKMRHNEKIIRSLLSDTKYSSRRGTAEAEELLSGKIFTFPKPLSLLRDYIKVATFENDIILDFFSGSSTTAQAVMQLNAEDNGNRQYIMVQLPELCKENSEAYKAGFKNICEIGKERIRLAGKKIKQEAGLNAKNLDTGFKVFRLAPSNIKPAKPYTGTDVKELSDWFSGDPLVEDWKPENLITEVMLKEGFPLDSTITTLNIYKKNKVFQVSSDFCKHSLIICFDAHVENDTVEKLDLGELNIFICLDSAINDQVKARLDDKGRIITI